MRRRSRSFLLASGVALLCGGAGLRGLAERGGPAAPLLPTYLGTAGLEAALAALRAEAEAGAWPGPLAGTATLNPGDRGEAVAALRARLAADGAAPAAPPADALLFDADLESAVRAVQGRLGLEPDGKVGPATRAELDRSPRDRMRQIARTLDSRRALPADLGERFLLLNLPAFVLEAVEAGQLALALRVVVGRPDRPTPTLASAVTRLVIHPVWRVPPRIARQEIAPRAARDPGYLDRLGFEVFPVASPRAPVDPYGVDWLAFQRGELDLALRQLPGPYNALGAVALQFTNPHNICLHDTPERALFERARRALSHGCVRVERVLDLARWLVGDASPASRRALEEAIRGVDTTELGLPAPVPIYIVDWPVWVDSGGALQLRPDLYPEGSPGAGGAPAVGMDDAAGKAGPPAEAQRSSRPAPR